MLRKGDKGLIKPGKPSGIIVTSLLRESPWVSYTEMAYRTRWFINSWLALPRWYPHGIAFNGILLLCFLGSETYNKEYLTLKIKGGWGRGEHDLELGGGERTEALRTRQKNENKWPQEEGDWEDPLECTRDLGSERVSGLKGDPQWWKALQWGELIESISSW